MSFLVSVIVPVYKAEPYIRKCIDSILSQTFVDFELLLVDDGSPDNCGNICDEYVKKDARVQVFHQENGGVSKARNLGLEHAKGDYVCFIDSDDWVDASMLETLIGWEREQQTDLLFYGFQCETSTVYSDTMELLQQCSGVYEGVNSIVEVCYLLEKNELFGWTWNKLFRNSIIQEYHIRFNEEISIQEDHIFTLEYLKYVMCLAVYGYTPYHYRVVQGSLINKVYSYSLCKKMLNLIFLGRIDLICRVENVNNVLCYRQYAINQYLSTLLYYYRISNTEIKNKLDELKDIRSKLRAYALSGLTIKMYILYLSSYMPIHCFELYLKMCSAVCKIYGNKIRG